MRVASDIRRRHDPTANSLSSSSYCLSMSSYTIVPEPYVWELVCSYILVWGGVQLHKAVFCVVKMVLFEHFIFYYTIFTFFLPHLAPPIGPDYIHAHIYIKDTHIISCSVQFVLLLFAWD